MFDVFFPGPLVRISLQNCSAFRGDEWSLTSPSSSPDTALPRRQPDSPFSRRFSYRQTPDTSYWDHPKEGDWNRNTKTRKRKCSNLPGVTWDTNSIHKFDRLLYSFDRFPWTTFSDGAPSPRRYVTNEGLPVESSFGSSKNRRGGGPYDSSPYGGENLSEPRNVGLYTHKR